MKGSGVNSSGELGAVSRPPSNESETLKPGGLEPFLLNIDAVVSVV